jgi:hypothetical protein
MSKVIPIKEKIFTQPYIVVGVVLEKRREISVSTGR